MKKYAEIATKHGDILVSVLDANYGGIERILLKNTNSGKWGVCTTGIFTPATTEALKNVDEDSEKLTAAQSRLGAAIKWFDTHDSLQEYFSSKEWQCQQSWKEEAAVQFVRLALDAVHQGDK